MRLERADVASPKLRLMVLWGFSRRYWLNGSDRKANTSS
jgi:hypothetical protein